MEQQRFFDISGKSYVEYKNNVFYFYSHIEGIKPIILNKESVKTLLASFKELHPIVWKEEKRIKDEIDLNARLVEADRIPIPPEEKLCYSKTISHFKVWEIRQQVSKYSHKLYVWTKLYVQDKEVPTTYYPCKGGILWPNPDYAAFEKFVDDCILNNKNVHLPL